MIRTRLTALALGVLCAGSLMLVSCTKKPDPDGSSLQTQGTDGTPGSEATGGTDATGDPLAEGTADPGEGTGNQAQPGASGPTRTNAAGQPGTVTTKAPLPGAEKPTVRPKDSVMTTNFDFSRDIVSQGKATTAKKITVLNVGDMTNDEIMLAESIQGIVAKSKAEIYLKSDKQSEIWLEDLKNEWGITYTEVGAKKDAKSDVWALVDKYKSYINGGGYVKYSLGSDSVSAATSVAGLKGYIMVTPALEAAAKSHGYTMKEDMTAYSAYNGIWSKYAKDFNKNVMFTQDNAKANLRDLSIFFGSYVNWGNAADLKSALSGMNKNALNMGFVHDEYNGIKQNSAAGVTTVASDWAMNMSLFTNLPRQKFTQQKTKKNAKSDGSKVHYVTFQVSDGDNLQIYSTGGLEHKQNYASPKRGSIPYGWSYPPTMTDFAPNIMAYAYRKQTSNDYFVAGVSGLGYMFPHEYVASGNTAGLKDFAEKSAYYMLKGDTNYMQMLDNTKKPDQAALDAFTAQSQIKGIYYSTFDDRYVGAKGALWWSNNKPVVAVRETLWNENTADKFYDAYKMAYRISTYDKNPSSINGYTYVNIHPNGDHSYNDAVKMVEWWAQNDPNVVVVAPDEFMELIVKNVPKSTATPNKSWNDKYTYPMDKFPSVSLAQGKTVKVSNVYKNEANNYGGQKLIDGDESSRWATDDDTPTAKGCENGWAEIDLGGMKTFSQAVIMEYEDRVKSYKIEYWDGSAWKTAHNGGSIGDLEEVSFKAVTGSKVKFSFVRKDKETSGPTFYEFQIYP